MPWNTWGPWWPAWRKSRQNHDSRLVDHDHRQGVAAESPSEQAPRPRRRLASAARLAAGGLVLALAAWAASAVSVQAAGRPTIVFADYGWDSALVHNHIARFIIEHGYGYKTDALPGETIPLWFGLVRGDVDVSMEVWIENQKEAYEQGIRRGQVVDLGVNFPDSVQGFFVPTYVIKGDPARGIKPMAPDLRSVRDLAKYKHLFRDPEEPSKGRFYNCIAGWECQRINTAKLKAYGLDKSFVDFLPGSGAALTASLVSAYEQGKPWVGYYWGPTWIFGQLDLTQLEEPPYSQACWTSNKACAYPSVSVHKVVNKSLLERAPDVVAFLRNYRTSMKLTSEVLAAMHEHNWDARQGAIWFLKNRASVWEKWVPADVARRVRAALK